MHVYYTRRRYAYSCASHSGQEGVAVWFLIVHSHPVNIQRVRKSRRENWAAWNLGERLLGGQSCKNLLWWLATSLVCFRCCSITDIVHFDFITLVSLSAEKEPSIASPSQLLVPWLGQSGRVATCQPWWGIPWPYTKLHSWHWGSCRGMYHGQHQRGSTERSERPWVSTRAS